MNSRRLTQLVILFIFVLVFSYTLASQAAGPPVSKCCMYINACGYIGYGSYQNGQCDCCYYGDGQGCYQGVYEGCMHACPATCM